MTKPYIKGHGDLPPGQEARFHCLRRSIQALAAQADDQLAVFPDFVLKAYELALDFDHWLTVGTQSLSKEQRARLYPIRQAFDDMSGGKGIASDQEMRDKTGRSISLMTADALARRPGPWTDDDLRTDDSWRQVRRLAAEALHSFGWRLDRPSKTSTVFVQFNR